MSRDGYGFERSTDPRIRARKAAGETQRTVIADAAQAAKDAAARLDDERLVADREDKRIQTAARRNRV